MKVFFYVLARYTSLIRYKICRCFFDCELSSACPDPHPWSPPRDAVSGMSWAHQSSCLSFASVWHCQYTTAPRHCAKNCAALPPPASSFSSFFCFFETSSRSPGWPQPFNMLVLQRCATVCLSSAFCFGVWNGQQW